MKLLQTSSAAERNPPSCKDGRESLGEEEPPRPPALLRCELRAGFVGRRAEVPSRRWGKGMRRATLTSISPPDVSKSYTGLQASPEPGFGVPHCPYKEVARREPRTLSPSPYSDPPHLEEAVLVVVLQERG